MLRGIVWNYSNFFSLRTKFSRSQRPFKISIQMHFGVRVSCEIRHFDENYGGINDANRINT